ncbi:MAG: hypothetical protein AAGG08_09780 [Actinomycetota bacterium]
MTRATMFGDMSRPSASETVDVVGRGYDLVAHASPLVLAIAASLAVGQPVGWIAFLFPAGPIVVIAVSRGVRGEPPRAWRSLLAFSLVSAVVVGGGWTLTQASGWWPPLSLLYPLGLLAFIAGLVNVVLVVLGRMPRAVRGWPFDYPWIPARLARAVGLPDGWEE